MGNKIKPPSRIAFSILLVLSPVPRHGYDIMKQIKADTDGRLSIGPGSLYGTIKQLLLDGLVEEVKDKTDEERRRYYRLTDKGKKILQLELKQYENTLRIATKRKLITNKKQELTI
jgi:DNA-binding PadR family transcriptional regulator